MWKTGFAFFLISLFLFFIVLPCEHASCPFPVFGPHWRDRGLKCNGYGDHWPVGGKLRWGSRCMFTISAKRVTHFFFFYNDVHSVQHRRAAQGRGLHIKKPSLCIRPIREEFGRLTMIKPLSGKIASLQKRTPTRNIFINLFLYYYRLCTSDPKY